MSTQQHYFFLHSGVTLHWFKLQEWMEMLTHSNKCSQNSYSFLRWQDFLHEWKCCCYSDLVQKVVVAKQKKKCCCWKKADNVKVNFKLCVPLLECFSRIFLIIPLTPLFLGQRNVCMFLGWVKGPLQSNRCVFSCSSSWLYEFHLIDWCKHRV